MRPCLAILLAFALSAAAVAGESDPLRAAEALKTKRQYLEAVALALGVARDAKQTPARRYAAFELAAETYKGIGCPREAIALYREALAALGRDTEPAAAAWWRVADIYATHLGAEETVQFLEAIVPGLDLAKLAPGHAARVLAHLAEARDKAGRPHAALAAAEAAMKVAGKSDMLVPATVAAARLHVRLHEFAKALACLSRLDVALGDQSAAYEIGRAYGELLDALAAAGKRDKLPALCRKIVKLFSTRGPSTAHKALAALLGAASPEAALAFVAALDDKEIAAVASETVLTPFTEAALRAGKADELVAVCVRAMLSRPLSEEAAWPCLKAIAELRLHQGRTADALAAARAAYSVAGFSTSSSSSFTRAVAFATHVLRARHGHLLASNAFHEYQLYGPRGRDQKAGTPDDIANPLGGVGFAPEPAVDRLFQAALRAQALSYEGRRRRAWICLLWCKPKDALREFRRAFALCSLDTTEFTRATQEVAFGLKALHATPAAMDAWYHYERYGPNGPDGRPKTRDDLKDPLPGL